MRVVMFTVELLNQRFFLPSSLPPSPSAAVVSDSDPFSWLMKQKMLFTSFRTFPSRVSGPLPSILVPLAGHCGIKVAIESLLGRISPSLTGSPLEVTIRMEVVGSEEPKVVQTKIFLVALIDMYGNTRSIWGYGVPRVMSSAVPSLLPVKKLFPHIPEDDSTKESVWLRLGSRWPSS